MATESKLAVRMPYVEPVLEVFEINSNTMGALVYGSDGVSKQGISLDPLAS